MSHVRSLHYVSLFKFFKIAGSTSAAASLAKLESWNLVQGSYLECIFDYYSCFENM